MARADVISPSGFISDVCPVPCQLCGAVACSPLCGQASDAMDAVQDLKQQRYQGHMISVSAISR